MTEVTLTYKDSGVDIEEGNALVDDIKHIAEKTRREGVLAGIGGFGALFQLPLQKYKEPVLVSSTDGVGTKIKLADLLNKHDTLGIDLVAMCVNDVVVQGAEPLFFLDYFATSQLNREKARSILSGIGKGCQLANAALIGGETAEMPGIYQGNDYDLAGFAVGIVEKQAIIDGKKATPGDVLLGIASSGPHSNGYSLIRKILQVKNIDLNTSFDNATLGEVLLTPTKIYVRSLLSLFCLTEVHAAIHITGGGIIENIPRVLPPYTQAVINKDWWLRPNIFLWIQYQGNVSDIEMLRTFNCGLGMVVCIPDKKAAEAKHILEAQGEEVFEIGHIASHNESKPRVLITGL